MVMKSSTALLKKLLLKSSLGRSQSLPFRVILFEVQLRIRLACNSPDLGKVLAPAGELNNFFQPPKRLLAVTF
jgi:hypothetical protein